MKLNIASCTLQEVEIKPIYDVGESSKMKIFKVIPKISLLLFKSFFKHNSNIPQPSNPNKWVTQRTKKQSRSTLPTPYMVKEKSWSPSKMEFWASSGQDKQSHKNKKMKIFYTTWLKCSNKCKKSPIPMYWNWCILKSMRIKHTAHHNR